MLLSQIVTDPDRLQMRSAPFSAATVEGIVAEGIKLAKYDPIPVFWTGKRWCVAGDGHSRFEAVRRLADADRLPREWRTADGWDVPCRKVSRAEALHVAWTANLSRDQLTPIEEARVYQSMSDEGVPLDEIGRRAHKHPAHVARRMALVTLARDIADAVGASADAGGIDVLTAEVLAAGFQRHGVGPQQQQDLWQRCLKSALLNFQSAKKFVDAIGPELAKRSGDGFLFELPANAAAVVAEAKQRGHAARSAKMGLALLVKAREAGGLDGVPELAAWLDAHGAATLSTLSGQVTQDADVLAAMVRAA